MTPLVIGGNSGIGLSIVRELMNRGIGLVYVVGKDDPIIDVSDTRLTTFFRENVVFLKENLVNDDLSFLESFKNIDALIITVGFGRVALFECLTESEIKNLLRVNFEAIVRIIKFYYPLICSDKDFYTAVMVSIAGRIVSPFFSVYGASKAGLRFFIENINSELKANGKKNRLLDVSPGSLGGTSFGGGQTDVFANEGLAKEIVQKMINRETLFIPKYDEIYKKVLQRYNENPELFGEESYAFKVSSGRMSNKPQITIGYLSGTFDLFHIGHLNLLKRAKEQCDYLIVSVHDSGAWKGKETFIPYNERKAIVESIKYVDEVVQDFREDSDAWDVYHYDKLFVGSDYKGTERFERYERQLEGKAEIIYFPYTQGTSSTQLRAALKK